MSHANISKQLAQCYTNGDDLPQCYNLDVRVVACDG